MTAAPEGWTEVALSDAASIGSGGTPSARNPNYYGGHIPWAVIGDLSDGPIDSTRASITSEGLQNSSAKVVPNGTILLAMYGSIGKLGVNRVPMATNQAIATLRPGPSTDAMYLFYYLMSQRRLLLERGKGAAQQNISQTVLRSWPVRLPSDISEQRRIVDLLEDHLSRLDVADACATSASQRTTLLLDRVFEAEISTLNLLQVAVGDLLASSLSNGKSVPTMPGGFPVLRLTALRNGVVDLAERKSGAWTLAEANRFLVRRGDFFVARGNGSLSLVGRGGLVVAEPDPVAFPDTLIRVRARTDMIDPTYLALAWNSAKVRAQLETAARTTAGIYKINQKDLAKVKLPVPSLEAQRQVASRVAEAHTGLSRLNAEMDRARTRGRGLRRALLAAAFSGRLTSQTELSDLSETMPG